MELENKLSTLHAMLLAITGSNGVEVLQDMGDDAANAYLAACQSLAHDSLTLARVTQVPA